MFDAASESGSPGAAGLIPVERGGRPAARDRQFAHHPVQSPRQLRRHAVSTIPTSAQLTFTGERFLPDVRGPIWYEHWHRYVAVEPIAKGRRVLDAACGEGYGSFFLAGGGARSVVGIDVSPDAVRHARARYTEPNLTFVAGSVTALPLAAQSVDLVVSFETIEHLAEQRRMLSEFRRVLTPAGALIISSPNGPVYNEGGGVENHYHVRELDREELKTLLDHGFPEQRWYGQRVLAQSAIWAERFAAELANEAGNERTDEIETDVEAGALSFMQLAADRPRTTLGPAAPMYFVVSCAAAGVTPPALSALSLFDDGDLSLWRDYARARKRERELAWDEIAARKVAEDRLMELVAAVNALASAREANAVHVERTAALEHVVAQARAQLEQERALHAQTEDAHARERAAHAETRARLTYRESPRGWLRYPFAAVKRHLADPR